MRVNDVVVTYNPSKVVPGVRFPFDAKNNVMFCSLYYYQ